MSIAPFLPTNFRSRDLMMRVGFDFLDNDNPDDAIGLLENQATREV